MVSLQYAHEKLYDDDDGDDNNNAQFCNKKICPRSEDPQHKIAAFN